MAKKREAVAPATGRPAAKRSVLDVDVSLDSVRTKTQPGRGGNPRHPSVKSRPNGGHVLGSGRPD